MPFSAEETGNISGHNEAMVWWSWLPLANSSSVQTKVVFSSWVQTQNYTIDQCLHLRMWCTERNFGFSLLIKSAKTVYIYNIFWWCTTTFPNSQIATSYNSNVNNNKISNLSLYRCRIWWITLFNDNNNKYILLFSVFFFQFLI